MYSGHTCVEGIPGSVLLPSEDRNSNWHTFASDLKISCPIFVCSSCHLKKNTIEAKKKVGFHVTLQKAEKPSISERNS